MSTVGNSECLQKQPSVRITPGVLETLCLPRRSSVSVPKGDVDQGNKRWNFSRRANHADECFPRIQPKHGYRDCDCQLEVVAHCGEGESRRLRPATGRALGDGTAPQARKRSAESLQVPLKSARRPSMAIVESHLLLDCARAASACSRFKRAPLLPRRCVDLRTTNSGCITTFSIFGETFEFSIPSAIRAASCPIRRLCWSILERGTLSASS